MAYFKNYWQLKKEEEAQAAATTTTNKPRKRRRVPFERLLAWVKNMVKIREEEIIPNIEEHHVIVQPGNIKTGPNCWTTSLVPVADCANCGECKFDCYDLVNDCFRKQIQFDRARNSAIHKIDRPRFWAEIEEQIKYFFISEFRFNVGGDLDFEDFFFLAELASRCVKTDFLFFTKNYEGINTFLDKYRFPENVHCIMSAWPGMKMDNRHNLPVAHVLFEDGTTTAPAQGGHMCGGNCSACHFYNTGCWALKAGECVIFIAH